MDRIPWRERAFLSFQDAGDIFARSPLWVREQIAAGKLREHRFPKGNPAVTVQSVLALVDQMLANPQRGTPTPNPAVSPANLRLAWDRQQDGPDLIDAILKS